MRVFITGGTGFIGNMLTQDLIRRGHQVTVIVRTFEKGWKPPAGAGVITGETTMPGRWQAEMSEHDAVINLAGASIFRRWTDSGRRIIMESRVLTTTNIVEALAGRGAGEMRLLSVSGVGYYGSHGDEMLDEDSPAGDDFLARVAVEWETCAGRARDHGASVALCRLGHVFGKNGGVLDRLVTLSKLRLGGHWGSGKQWVSWVHASDLMEVFSLLLDNRDMQGPFNVSSPNPVRNRELMRLVRQAAGARTLIPRFPSPLLRMAAGEFATVFLDGQRVIPRRLLDGGFSFRYPDLGKALEALL